MKSCFIDIKDYGTVKEMVSWGHIFVECEKGYMVFESYEAYEIWKNKE